MDSADPLDGYSVTEVVQKAPLAKNDIYGSLFLYLQDTILKFCKQVKRLKVSFQLFQTDAVRLPSMIQQREMSKTRFDRIEVSNIGDRGYLGPQMTLATFGPLLKIKAENPHATLLLLFLNAIHEVSTAEDHLGSMKPEIERIRKYLELDPAVFRNRDGMKYSADFHRFNDGRLMFRDFDKLFSRFHQECQLDKIGEAVGLEMKWKNTIIEPWPMRIKKNATQDEFNFLLGSSHTGSERYVEWRSLA
ncbi:hypothetical protein MMC25_000866 [Agyrium rufum]|nr:hypothetical protein [Agyrium rufum]